MNQFVTYDVGQWNITTNTASTTATDYYSWANNSATDVNSIISDTRISEIAWHTYVKAQQWRGGRIPVDPVIVRQPTPRAFNRYINGSDLLQEFIHFLGSHQVRKAEALKIPLELVIQWLIIEAAKADDEEPPVKLRLPAKKLRCLSCSRVLKRKTAIMLCSTACVMRRLRTAA